MTAYTNFLKLRAQAYNENVDAWDVVLNENFQILDFVTGQVGTRNRLVSGGAVSAGAGLNVDYTAIVAELSGADINVAAGSVALAASALNYIYLGSSGAVAASSSPPSGEYCPLAVVDTSDVGIDRIGDARQFTPAPMAPRENLIINPEFTVNQEVYAANGTATLADQEYGHDMWKNVTGSTQKYSVDGSGNVDLDTIELGQKNDDILAADGKTVTFSVAAGSVQISGLGVAAWTTVTPSTPLTWTLAGTGGGGWLMLKKDGTSTFRGPKLEIGHSVTPFLPRLVTTETLLCYRYFWERKSLGFEQSSNHTYPTFPVFFPVEMRVTPAVTIAIAGNYGGAAVSSANAWGLNTKGFVGIVWDTLPGTSGPYRFSLDVTVDARY